jgi:hypothetical protein
MTRKQWIIGGILLFAALFTPWNLPLLLASIGFFWLGRKRGRSEVEAGRRP